MDAKGHFQSEAQVDHYVQSLFAQTMFNMFKFIAVAAILIVLTINSSQSQLVYQEDWKPGKRAELEITRSDFGAETPAIVCMPIRSDKVS